MYLKQTGQNSEKFNKSKSTKLINQFRLAKHNCNLESISRYGHDHTVKKLFTTRSRLLMTLGKKHFKKIVGKEENAGNQHFHLFPQCFLPYQEHKLSFELLLKCRMQMLSNWTGLKFSCLEKR